MEFTIEVEDCMHCPCLRQDEWGLTCFYNAGHKIDLCYLDEIDKSCPFKEEEDEINA